jgi:DNA-binding response OmpR family regulator
MRVLVVEDDRALGLFLQKGLKIEGHAVDWVGDGEIALDHARMHQPDLMVLDLGLPRRDGIEVLEQMRHTFANTSVLVLTGRSQMQERIRCLDLGADDVLMKPFGFHELTARCRAVLRRRERFSDPILRFGAIEMNRLERNVLHEGVKVELTATEFTLLEALLRRQGRCCSRGQLLAEVWEMDPASGTNVVDVYVNYLRKKLAAVVAPPNGKAEPSVIETVRGSGYRLRPAREKLMHETVSADLARQA